MKNHLSKITIILAAIISVLLVSCIGRNSKRYYETPTGKTITVWGDYVIFEKHKGELPPKDNYITIDRNHEGSVKMFLKSNDSIIIFRRGNDNMEIGFDQEKYKVEIYENTWEDLQEFEKRTAYSDPLVILGFYYSAIFDLGGDESNISIIECVGDSVYFRHHGLRSLNLPTREHVYSRHDESLKQPYF